MWECKLSNVSNMRSATQENTAPHCPHLTCPLGLHLHRGGRSRHTSLHGTWYVIALQGVSKQEREQKGAGWYCRCGLCNTFRRTTLKEEGLALCTTCSHDCRATIAGHSEVCVPRSSKMTIESDVWVHFTQEQLAGYNKICSDVEAGPR